MQHCARHVLARQRMMTAVDIASDLDQGLQSPRVDEVGPLVALVGLLDRPPSGSYGHTQKRLDRSFGLAKLTLMG